MIRSLLVAILLVSVTLSSLLDEPNSIDRELNTDPAAAPAAFATSTVPLNHTKPELYLVNDNSNYNWHDNLLELYEDIKFWRDLYIIAGSGITCVGTMLNMLCIVIFYKSKLFRNSSFPYYVYIISIVDTMNILIRFFIPQLIEQIVRSILVSRYHVDSNELNSEKYDKYTSYITSDQHCSLLLYFTNSLTLTSVWLMCAVSLERWLVIQFTLQSKYMIKLRAFIILVCIFLITFSFNVFDLAPGLYIKPQWYANLTLLCERDDTVSTESNADINATRTYKSSVYKRLGILTFNTETFAFIRTIFLTGKFLNFHYTF